MITDALRSFSNADQILLNEPMAKHTTFRVGGPAEILYFPASSEQLARAVSECRHTDTPYTVIGNGSNLLVRDGGIRGVTIVLSERMAKVSIAGDTLTAQAGALLSSAARCAQGAGLTGMEALSGIPGTVGGGCVMNAGAYGGQISDIARRVTLLTDTGVITLDNAQMRFGYRTSLAQTKNMIVLAVDFSLGQDDPAAIQARMNEFNQRRRDKQPLTQPSAGSVFKRPEGYFAGALIEGAGLKGFSVGGAAVSEKHAGFIVNAGGATANDVLALIHRIQNAVYDRYGVRLETEIRVLGE